MREKLIFGGVDSSDYGGYLFEYPEYTVPERMYREQTVPGKNGAVVFDQKRFSDVRTEYDLVFIGKTMQNDVIGFRNAIMSLSGYQRLQDSFNSDEFYEAFYDGSMKIKFSRYPSLAKMRLTFQRKPQRFLASGEEWVEIAEDTTLTNPTLFASNPLIRVYGTGSFSVNGNTVTITSNTGYVDVDSELQDCYHVDENRNSTVSFSTGNFPQFVSGENEITIPSVSGVDGLEVQPRWWRV